MRRIELMLRIATISRIHPVREIMNMSGADSKGIR